MLQRLLIAFTAIGQSADLISKVYHLVDCNLLMRITLVLSYKNKEVFIVTICVGGTRLPSTLFQKIPL